MTDQQKNFLKSHPLVIFSASAGGYVTLRDLKKLKIKPSAFCDSSKEKQGGNFHGYPVISPEKLLELHKNKGAVAIIASRSYYNAIYNQLISLGMPDSHILSYCLTKELTPITCTEEQMSELKKIMLDILIITHNICEKHNIDYYLHCGTLLGAVRHKGFIPWDDDVDILMPRKDSERFFKICETELPDGYSVARDCDVYTGLYTIYKVGTTRLPTWYQHDCTLNNFSVNIDIFPLDNVKKKNGFLHKFQDAANIVLLSAYKIKVKIGHPSYRFYGLSVLLSPLPPKVILGLRLKIITMLNGVKTDYVSFFHSDPNWLERLTYESELFKKKVKLEFEGHMLWAPEKYDAILTQVYGKDYMSPPPDKDKGRHATLKLVL